ncbi:MAG: Re/Si-specific NAD(P)(+) transhydrogenase subunit alpha [Maricaulaceae bacterium]|jgi:NAD(P) transhydrogenase subunit alpha
MKIAVLKERRDGETRVAATPETVKKMIAAGHAVAIEKDAGAAASIPDVQFTDAGASIAPDAAAAVSGADLVIKVRAPLPEELSAMKSGAALVGLLAPHGDPAALEAYAKAGIDAFSMEFTPRITRAQSMDALSSQSNLAGYRAVIEAANAYGQAFPMMMTAAGTVPAAKVFVMGAGVAGLQAIATAKRLGAIVSATDVRPAAKEQVASLAAKFVAVEDEEFKAAETAGGYAKEMSDEYKAKQAELIASHIAKQDVVITTALIPGRPAPKLVSAAMVASMQPGSVLVDLAIEAGGNIEGAKLGEVVETANGAKILGFANLPGRLAKDASALYAKNLLNLLPLLSSEDGALAPHADDEIIQGMQLTRGGAVVHPSFVKEPA